MRAMVVPLLSVLLFTFPMMVLDCEDGAVGEDLPSDLAGYDSMMSTPPMDAVLPVGAPKGRGTNDPLPIQEIMKFTSSDGVAGDYFGDAVSVSDNIIVVGTPMDDVDGTTDQGSAHIYERNRGGNDKWGLVKRLVASDGTSFDNFGISVSVHGDTIVVGASGDDVGGSSGRGSAYIFKRNTGGADNWGLVKKLTASDGIVDDRFGESVSISGDVIVVGAFRDGIGTSYWQGSAYLFLRNLGGADNWGQSRKLTASDGTYDDYFGISVSISGDTIVIGAYGDDAGGHSWQGSAYVFRRNEGGADNWGQVKKLYAGDGWTDDHFGSTVSISGSTIVVGAYGSSMGPNNYQGAAYVFERNAGGADNWGQVRKLLASDGSMVDLFGESVSISGDVLIVGASWDDIGANVDRGSAYVFERNMGGADNWGEVERITATGGTGDDHFGEVVAMDGNIMVIGAPWDDIGGKIDQGSVCLFIRLGDIWLEENRTVANDGAAEDYFGHSVSVSGDTIVIGAGSDDIDANTDQGSAYVLERNNGGAENWGQVAQLTASDGEALDRFGYSVSVSGDTIVVGARYDKVGENAGQGSAYIFERNEGGADNWGQVAQLTASDGAAGDLFGWPVSISGDAVIIGAPWDDVGTNTDQGSVYLFERNTGGADKWGQVKQLTASDGNPLDRFGWSVSMFGDTMVIGASYDDVGSNTRQGSAYIFERNAGGADNWGQVAQLTAGDGGTEDLFGWSASISGDTTVIGAFQDDVGANLDQASAYVFERNAGGADNWGQVAKLIASDGVSYDYFGNSVSVTGDTIVIGAYFDDIDGKGDQGSVHVFDRNTGGADNWGQVARLTASDGATGDHFGRSVSVSGDTIVIGASEDDVGANADQGSAYLYYLHYEDSPPDIDTTDVISTDEDALYSVDYNATDPDIWDVLKWGLDTDAIWLSMDVDTGVLSGIPQNDDIGIYWVNVSVDDGHGGLDWTEFRLTVLNTNDAPVIATADDIYAVEDILYSMDYNATDPDVGDIQTWSLDTNAMWLWIDVDDGILSGTPDNSYVGVQWVNVSVDDRYGGSDWSNFTLTVLNTNDAPVITTSDDLSAFEDELFSVDYDATDPDAGSIQAWSLDTNAMWLGIDIGTGVLSGIPDNDQVGIHWVNVSVDDGHDGLDWSNFTITVVNTNDAPFIVTTNDVSADEDAFYRVKYVATDPDVGDILTWGMDTDASWLSMEASTGVLSGRPDNGHVGTYWVNVTVDDGSGGQDRTDFIMTVLNTNDLPTIITTDDIDADEDVQYYVDYNATDPDVGDILTWELSTNATWLNIDAGTGVLSGTPDRSNIGVYWVKVMVNDGKGGEDDRDLTLTVKPRIDDDDIEDDDTGDDDDTGSFSLYPFLCLVFILMILLTVALFGYILMRRRRHAGSEGTMIEVAPIENTMSAEQEKAPEGPSEEGPVNDIGTEAPPQMPLMANK